MVSENIFIFAASLYSKGFLHFSAEAEGGRDAYLWESVYKTLCSMALRNFANSTSRHQTKQIVDALDLSMTSHVVFYKVLVYMSGASAFARSGGNGQCEGLVERDERKVQLPRFFVSMVMQK